MTPKQIVHDWVDIFNSGATKEIAALYHEDAVNHQVIQESVVGRLAIEKNVS